MKAARKLRWALVLSGGGAKGFAHVGVLRALEGLGVPAPSLVVGTSMGAVVGGLYACDTAPARLEEILHGEFNLSRMLDSADSPLSSGSLSRLAVTGRVIGNLATKSGADSGTRILHTLAELSGGKSFAETTIPFRCNAVDLLTGEEMVYSEGELAKAIRASISYPGFLQPFNWQGRLLVDGGVVNNLPVDIPLKLGYTHVLAVDVGPFRQEKPENLKHALDVVLRSVEIASTRAGQASMPGHRPFRWPNILTLDCDTGHTSLDFDKGSEIAGIGRNVVERNAANLERFFNPRPLDRARKSIYSY